MANEHMSSWIIPPVHRLNNGSGCRSRWKMRLRSPCHDRVRGTVVHAGWHTARPLAPNILWESASLSLDLKVLHSRYLP